MFWREAGHGYLGEKILLVWLVSEWPMLATMTVGLAPLQLAATLLSEYGKVDAFYELLKIIGTVLDYSGRSYIYMAV